MLGHHGNLAMSNTEIFCHSDLWAAEAIITALEAKEYGMLDMLMAGIKIHSWLLEQVKDRFPGEVKAQNYDYKKAKQSVHSLNYDVAVGRMCRENGLSYQVNQCIYNFYHTTFPGIKLRHQRIIAELRSSRSVTSLLGRKRIYFMPWGDELFKSAFAWPSQSCIGELTNIVLTKLYYWGEYKNPWMLPALNTHDGISTRCFIEDKDKIRGFMKKAYNIPLTYAGRTVTVPPEIAWGANFNEAEDKEVLWYGK
jgi:hypothetical protein